MGSRLWLRILLWSFAAISCSTHLLGSASSVWHPMATADTGCLFVLGIILSSLLLVNERIANWRRGEHYVVGPGVVAGLTIPTVILAGSLSLVAYAVANNPQGLGWTGLAYILFPMYWLAAVTVGTALGGFLDLR
jgi:hypothetical protein